MRNRWNQGLFWKKWQRFWHKYASKVNHMNEKYNNYQLCGILNTPDINLWSVMELNDSVSFLFSSIDVFLEEALLKAKALRDKDIKLLRTIYQGRLDDLKRMASNVGAVDLGYEIAQIEHAVAGRRSAECEVHIEQLIGKCARLTKSFQDCLIEADDDEEEMQSSPSEMRLSTAVERVMNNPVPKILLVDDAMIILNTVKAILKDKYSVYALTKGEMVEDFLRAQKIDLFILDIEMPDMDGYTLFSMIRQMPLYRETPIMFFTSHASREYVQTAISLRVSDYIVKPIVPKIMLKKISAVLDKKG